MVKREGGKHNIGIVIFKCDKCGNIEKYRQSRGGFIKLDDVAEQIIEQKVEVEQKEMETKKNILWFDAKRFFK